MVLSVLLHLVSKQKQQEQQNTLSIADKKATDLKSCILSCCASDTCHVAFLYETSCFMIRCNTSHPSACDPEERTGDKYKNTFMVNAREIGKHVIKAVCAAEKNRKINK